MYRCRRYVVRRAVETVDSLPEGPSGRGRPAHVAALLSRVLAAAEVGEDEADLQALILLADEL